MSITKHARCNGVSLSKDFVLSLLKVAVKRKDIQAGRRIHLLMLSHGLYTHSILADHLIHLFALCKSLSESLQSFRMVPYPSVFTWNIVISAHLKLGGDEKAMDLFIEMQSRGTKPDNVTFSCILKVCVNVRALKQGRFTHDLIIRTGLKESMVMESTLVDMYAKCGSVREAHNVFNNMEKQDVITWGTMVAAYAEQDGIIALELFNKMQGHDFLKPNIIVFSSVLKACGSIKDLNQGKVVHDKIERSGLQSDFVIGSTLVDMYVKCESIHEARATFDRLEMRDIVTWGTMMHGYVIHKQCLNAFQLFETMKMCGLIPNTIIFECLLEACNVLEDIEHGRILECQISALELQLNPCMYNTLLYMYCKAGSLNEAHRVFHMWSSHDFPSWDYLIDQYVQNGHFISAFNLYEEMQEEGILPNKSTIFMHLLKACQGLGVECLDKAMLIHYHIITHGFELDEATGSSLLILYAKCGSIKSAKNVFETFQNSLDVVSWGAMMAGYVYQGDGLSALKLFEEMQRRGIRPTDYVLSCTLKACASLYALEQGRWIHDHVIRSGYELNVVVDSCIIDMYAKYGHLKDANVVFMNVSNRDSTSWGAMIAGYVTHGDTFKAFECFKQMQEEGVTVDKVVCSNILQACGTRRNIWQGRLICDTIIQAGINVDVVLGNSMIDMYAKCGSLTDARKSFDFFHKKDLVSWGAMIGGYVANGESMHALKLFEVMQKDGLKPNNVLYISILKACGSTGMVWLIRFIHDQIVRNELESDRAIGNTLVNVYGKCGNFLDARKVFDNLPGVDVISWASIVSGLSRDGNSTKLAQQCFKDIHNSGLNKKPEGASFINMLSACTHAGILEDALNFFEGVTGNDVPSPLTLELYGCMIDLLGRTGCLKEADDLIQTMPSFPDFIIWTSLLTSCRIYGNTYLGTQCFNEAGT